MSERKINIEEILLQNHFHILDTLKKIYSPDTHTESMYERLMNGIKDVCEKTLELAAENAKLVEITEYPFMPTLKGEFKEIVIKAIDKQSILGTIKQIE